MIDKKQFRSDLFSIALPVTLQSLLQSSFSIADQIMVGQLGSVSIAAIGLAGKFSGLCNVVVSAVVTAASIMLSQYVGKKDKEGEYRSFKLTGIVALSIALLFTLVSFCLPQYIMRLYSPEHDTVSVASSYLKIVSLSFIPMTIMLMASAALRCRNKAKLPMYATFASAILNTILNYVFIFILKKGAEGAAIATVLSQLIAMVVVVFAGFSFLPKKVLLEKDKDFFSSFLKILVPILLCEFLWSLGENVYGAVYGHLGTDSAAAMMLSYPIQNIMIGTLSGVSQAAGIMVGKKLGNKEYDDALWESKKLVEYGAIGSVIISLLIVALNKVYLKIYNVTPEVMDIASKILLVYALVAPVKVMNMILSGGIIRSGGRTDLVMYTDITGTWLFGVPLSLISSRILNLPIHYVYLILSLEECVRLFIGWRIYKGRKWMKSL